MKKIGLLCLALVLALGAMGGGVAWFSSTETVPSTFEASTMDLEISPDGGTTWYGDTVYSYTTPSDWAPGDSDTLELDLRITGTNGAKLVLLCGENLVEHNSPGDLRHHIYITELDATDYSGDTASRAWMGCPISYWEGVLGNGSSPFTLAEFVCPPADCNRCAAFFEGWPGSVPCVQWLDYLGPARAHQQKVKITFKFDENAGNEYQGDKVTFDLKIVATDDCTTTSQAPH